MDKKKILIVVGTRPNFIKITQFKKEALKYPLLDLKIVHTGQHFDDKMSSVFFNQFELMPDFFLNISAQTPTSQIAEIITALENTINNFRPNLVCVVGDVNSTLAASIVANKMQIKLAHIESGLRSFDNSMPEEHNRVLTDNLADYYFITEQSGFDNLINERKNAAKLYFVGNTMIDTMVAFENEIEKSDILTKYNLPHSQYVLMTMHRPSNVDAYEGLLRLKELMLHISKSRKIIFPIHPRTLKRINEFGLQDMLNNNQIIITDPLDYFSFQKLIKYAKYIVTDSGGIQEESTFLKVPCLTLRPNTERPVTVIKGTNELLPFDIKEIEKKINQIESGNYKKGEIPEMWDGKSTERIIKHLNDILNR